MGRSHKRRAAPPPAAPAMHHPFMMMMPAMPMQPQPQEAAASDTSSSSDSDDLDTRRKYAKGAEARITSSAKFIARLPKTRLQELCESACADLDSTLTANVDEPTLCRLLYMSARIRPNTKICNLRAKSYKVYWNILGVMGRQKPHAITRPPALPARHALAPRQRRLRQPRSPRRPLARPPTAQIAEPSEHPLALPAFPLARPAHHQIGIHTSHRRRCVPRLRRPPRASASARTCRLSSRG